MDDSIPYSHRIQNIFIENPEHYSDIKNLLPEIRKRICTKEHLRKAKVFMPNGFNYGVTDGNLVRFRCIMPMPHTIQTDNYPPRFIGALDNGMNAEFTMAFFNYLDLGIFAQINFIHCATQSRQVYKVCKLPGECSWATLPQDNDSIDAIGKPKMEQEYVKLYIYDNPMESRKPEANAIIELYGIFYARRELKNVPVRVNIVNYIRSDFFYYNHLRYPTIHVIQHKIIELKDLIPRPDALYAKTYEMLLGFAKSLTGSEIGGRYLIAALASKNYSMAKEPLQLWNLPIAFINVTNSETMVDCLKLLCPAVRHIKITKQLLENEPLFPIFDNTFQEVKGNHLLHAKGTVIVCDFTKYEGYADTTQTAYAQPNMFSLRHLIEKQELVNLVYFSANTPTDAIVIVLLRPGQKEVPCSSNIPVVSLPLPINFTNEPDLACELIRLNPDSSILSNFRWLLMQTREKLKDIVCPPDIPQMFGANTPSHIITLMRIQTALEGRQAITVELYNRVKNWEEDRQNIEFAHKFLTTSA